MRICGNCGEAIQDGELFCAACGTRASEVTQEAATPVAEVIQEATQEAATPVVEVIQEATQEAATPVVEVIQEATQEAATPVVEVIQEATQEAATPVAAVATAVGRRCTQCGELFEEDALFCASCGTKNDAAPAPESVAEFCPTCGERLDADAAFCAGCGTNVRQAVTAGVVAPATKKKGVQLNGKALGAVCAVAGLVAVVCLAANLFQTPASRFAGYEKSFIKSGVAGVGALVNQVDDYGSFSTDVEITATSNIGMVNKYLEGSALTLKLDMGKDSLLINADAKLMGSRALSAIGTYNKGVAGFCIPEVDATYYTANLDRMLKNSGASVGAVVLESFDMPSLSGAALEKLAMRYTKILLSTANKKNVTVTKDDIYLRQLRETVSGKIYTFQPAEKEIEQTLVKLANEMKTDKELRTAVISAMGSGTHLAETQYYVAQTGLPFEKWLDQELRNFADELKREAPSMANGIVNSGLRITLGVAKGQICLNRIETNYGGVAYEAYGKLKDELRIAYYPFDDVFEAPDQAVVLSVSRAGSKLAGRVSVYSYGDTPAVLSFSEFQPTKRSALGIPYGTYRLSADESMTMELVAQKGTKSGTDHKVTVAYGGMSGMQSVEVTVTTSDKKSTAKKPEGKAKDITNYTPSELSSLFYEIGMKLSANPLLGNIMNLL